VKPYGLGDRFREPGLERSVLAALRDTPNLYWQLLDTLAPGTFSTEAAVWEKLSGRLERDEAPAGEVPAEWNPSTEPASDAEKLADLYQRRLLAEAQERLAAALSDPAISGAELARQLEEEGARVQTAIRELESGRATYASDLVADVIADARARYDERVESGKPVTGIRSGIPRLDEITGGFEEGLYLLAAGPGVGKTTLATQVSKAVASSGDPAIFATFENSAHNLLTKILCAEAGLNTRDVRRGYADPERLARAAATLAPVLSRIVLVEGSGRLTVAQLRARALQAMNRCGSDKCLIVVEMRGLMSVRERVEALAAELRELAARLKNPVLAIASQNRAGAGLDYKRGSGATLDSLKESGDLEYAADVVMFLTEAHDREATHPARAVDLSVGKNRNGETGRVELIFRPDLGVLREAAPTQANGHAGARI
jgi:replicative DNA helicase